MRKLEVMVILIFLQVIYAESDHCPLSKCRSHDIPVRFPFRLDSHQPQNCGYPGFDLSCNNQGFTVLELPYSGGFIVRSINYLDQQIQLYDSEGCLARRLLNFNLSGSPFAATSYINYTFLSCPSQFIKSRFTYIACLSNATTSVIATSIMSLVYSLYPSCQILTTVAVPASWKVKQDEGFTSELNKDLQLAWDSPDCEECEVEGNMCGFLGNSSQQIIGCLHSKRDRSPSSLQVFKILGMSVGLPTMLFGVSIVSCAYYTNRRAQANAVNPSVQNSASPALPPQPVIGMMGLDESTIESYQKIVVGESKRLPEHNDITCAICLCEYRSKDIVRCIPECNHCFHADCIDVWLRVNRACPVCRHFSSSDHAIS